MANYYGDMGLGNLTSGLNSIVSAFQGMQQRNQLAALGQQIQSGDLLGAADSAIQRGNLDLGLKLYQLHQDNTYGAGLGEKLRNIVGSPTTPVQTGRSAAVVPTAAASLPASYASAVAGGETSPTDPSAYSTTGVVIPKTGDRAYGKYQVMGANVGPWTKEVLGQEMSPEDFLANPQAQEAVFKGKFGQYVQKYGPDGAARAWFAGERGMNNPNATDPLGTSVSSYAAGFNRRLGQPPASAAIDTAMGTAPDGTPIVAAGQRRLGQPPADSTDSTDTSKSDDSAEVNALIAKRNQLTEILMDPHAAKFALGIQAAIKGIDDQIKNARDVKQGDPISVREYQQAQSDPKYAEFLRQRELAKHPSADPDMERQKRLKDLAEANIDPASPAGQFYRLNGSLPANFDQMKGAEATEFAKKQDSALRIQQQLEQLKEARDLNDKAYAGPFADLAVQAHNSGAPAAFIKPDRAVATAQFKNNVQMALMSMGKDAVGSRVAVYEEKLIQDLKANPNMAADVRASLLDKFIKYRQQALDAAQKDVSEMKAGTRFKKGVSATPAKAAPVTINGYTIEPAD